MISTKPSDQFRTPVELFTHYDRIYNFTIDGAAQAHDTLCQTWWGPGHILGGIDDYFDTTDADWANQRIWINPPYSMIPQFLAHYVDFGQDAPVVTWLLPAWTDRRWWHTYVWNRPDVSIEFLPGRLKFLNPDGSVPLGKKGQPQRGQFPSCVVTMFGV